MPAGERERLIIEEAIRFFAEFGFEGQTRELAARLGVTQPLLYRYFPTKDDLIDRVYEEVYVSRWKREWDAWLGNADAPLMDRLKRYYHDYHRTILTYEWVRIFMYAGLKGVSINQRYLQMVRERVFVPVVTALRHEHNLPTPEERPITETEIELVYGLHAAVFYIGVRKFIYGLPVPDDIDPVVDAEIETFLGGVGPVLRRLTING